MPFITVATLQDVPTGKAKQVEVNKKKLALFNVDGRYFAIDDSCPHRGASLAEGDCHDFEVSCPWHGARFNLQTGAHLCPPAIKGVKAYPVRVEANEVQVEMT
jgi:nitrite reductase/ring-hydroxylating ferredoxin subunit